MRRKTNKTRQWTCAETLKTLPTRKAYRAYLRRQVPLRLANVPRTRARREFNGRQITARGTVSTFGDLVRFLEENVHLLLRRNVFPYDADGRPRAPHMTVRFEDMRWMSSLIRRGDDWVSGWRGTMHVEVANYDWFVRVLFQGSGLILDAGEADKVIERRPGTTYVRFFVHVPDWCYPNIAFLARMQGRIDPNAVRGPHGE